jgi:hypothetical protein
MLRLSHRLWRRDLNEMASGKPGAVHIAFGVGHEDAVTVQPRALHDRLCEIGKERVGQIGNDQTDRPGAPGARRLGAHVLPVAEVLGYPKDMGSRFFTERSVAIDGIGGARERYPGRLGDILQRHPFDHDTPDIASPNQNNPC